MVLVHTTLVFVAEVYINLGDLRSAPGQCYKEFHSSTQKATDRLYFRQFIAASLEFQSDLAQWSRVLSRMFS